MMAQPPKKNRPSRIHQLPPELKEALDRLLREGRHTQQQILDHVNKLLPQGEEPISYSGLNRYAVRMSAVGARLRETREVAQVWTAKFGDEPTSDVLQLVVEMVQSSLFRFAMRQEESGDDEDVVDAEQLKDVALAIQRLAAASALNAKRQKEIRLAVAEQAANEAETVGREQGLSAEAVRTIKQKILGIA